MNRAERRRAKRAAEKPKTYVLTEDQIQQLKREATEQAFQMLLAIPALVLHDKFGFGQVRLDRFNHYAFGWVKAVQTGEVSIDAVIKLSEQETGYTITKQEG